MDAEFAKFARGEAVALCCAFDGTASRVFSEERAKTEEVFARSLEAFFPQRETHGLVPRFEHPSE